MAKTVIERTLNYEKAALLSRMGYSMVAIAKQLKMNVNTVSQYLDEVKEEYRAVASTSYQESQGERLLVLRDVRREAWEALQKSKEDTVRVRDETIESEMGLSSRRSKQVEGRVAGAQYMRIILDTIQQERDILGLDAPTKIDMRKAVMTLDWNALCTKVGERDPVLEAHAADPLEAKIKAMEEKAVPPTTRDS